jgi:hypothetical protein
VLEASRRDVTAAQDKRAVDADVLRRQRDVAFEERDAALRARDAATETVRRRDASDAAARAAGVRAGPSVAAGDAALLPLGSRFVLTTEAGAPLSAWVVEQAPGGARFWKCEGEFVGRTAERKDGAAMAKAKAEPAAVIVGRRDSGPSYTSVAPGTVFLETDPDGQVRQAYRAVGGDEYGARTWELMDVRRVGGARKDEATMATTNGSTPAAGLVQTLTLDATDAAWRTAGAQFVRLARDPLCALLARHLGPEDPALRGRIAAFLETEVGAALVAALLAAGLSAVPGGVAGEVPARLARELRVRAMAETGDLVAEVLMGPLREVMAMYLRDVQPAVATAAPAALEDGGHRSATPIDAARERAAAKGGREP